MRTRDPKGTGAKIASQATARAKKEKNIIIAFVFYAEEPPEDEYLISVYKLTL
jgi:phage terminase large subunit-like protein